LSGFEAKEANLITIRGRVQGVGFRPFVYRLAMENGLRGWVRNTNEGLTIFLEGAPGSLKNFRSDLNHRSPEASSITGIIIEDVKPEGFSGFEIRSSLNLSDEITEISPDIAVCAACLNDMKTQQHRIDYPLINCTHCGPRFTIIKDLPYDRPNTTMDNFPMCATCTSEYEHILDRRFHAQPVACNRCGPAYELWKKGRAVPGSLSEIVREAAEEIRRGGIVALKGVGGFHLVCDAGNQDAVLSLRKRKGRESKPLAVMFRDVEQAGQVVRISPVEERALISWRRPIVLLQQSDGFSSHLAPALNEGLATLGVLLPYMPFHYLLMEHLEIPAVVLTSGNFSEQPILIENNQAINQFGRVADLVITHQREIYNRVDDSVVRQMGDQERLFRRARGFCPDPLPVTLPVNGILAMGAELVNSFCIGKGNRAYLSQYIGDLKNPPTQEFYRDTIDRFRKLFRIEPTVIVTDLHPEYYSTKSGRELKLILEHTGKQITMEEVQHHHAHIAACMAEHHLDEQVIGVAFDGTGLGSDGHSWGSEIMLADLERFQRISHFEYLLMPGGDKVVEQPWRMALSALYHTYGEKVRKLNLPFMLRIPEEEREWILQMLCKRVNTPLTCGAGRYFDAVAAMLNLCLRSGYEGEGPMKLEALTTEGITGCYPVEHQEAISFVPVFRMIAQEISLGVQPEQIATKFHNTVITAIIQTVLVIRKEHGLERVVLSGGVFQNRYLVEHLVMQLEKEKFNVYLHAVVPPNDGGVSLGQLVIAAKRRAI